MKQQLKGEALLFLAALIWGVSFVFQKAGMDYIGPMTFTMLRFLIGAIVLLPCVYLYDRSNTRKGIDTMPYTNRILLKAGILTGFTNFGLSSLQQIGLVYTTAGKAGFISVMYVALVPVFMLFLHRKIHPLTWVCILVSLVGLYLLCMTGSARDFLHINIGDPIVLSSSIFSAAQIILFDKYANRVNLFRMLLIQFVVVTILSGFCAFAFETPALPSIIDCRIPLLYTGILEIGAAYSLEAFGQKTAPPVIATIIMSLESVFAVLAGALFLHEIMSGREITGCVIMFIALLLIQIVDTPKETNEQIRRLK